MTRPLLSTQQIAPSALKTIASFYPDVVQKVAETVQKEKVVIVGMAQNPFVKKARKALDDAKVPYTYLEYGSYFSQWKQRLAIKLWSGWPTFPQVFLKGQLIGGCTDLQALLAKGDVKL